MTTIGYNPPTYQVGNNSKIATTITQPVASVAPPKVSLLDKILNVGTKVTDFANKGVATYQNINQTLNPQQQAQAQAAAQAAAYTYQSPGSAQAAQNKGISTGAKVGIGVAVAALVTGVVVLISRGKKKGMGGLGDLNAKGKTKQAAQRAAVFARLDKEGKTYPKNKRGNRAKYKRVLSTKNC
jgi:uncharacterized membrane protein